MTSNPGATIAVVDYGMGNLRSVQAALEYLGARAVLSSDPEVLGAAAALVLPGVGSFRAAMENLHARGLASALRTAVVERGTPLLGICLGMQLLAEVGEEDGPTPGLGLIRGEVRRLHAEHLPVPHMGFNQVRFASAGSPLFSGLGDAADFYFVHSFRMECAEPADVSGWCTYGERFVACVERGAVFGTQFHPEKSQTNGLRLVRNFLDRVSARW